MEILWMRISNNYGYSSFESFPGRYGNAEVDNPAFMEWAQQLYDVQNSAIEKAVFNLPPLLKNLTLKSFLNICYSFEEHETHRRETKAERAAAQKSFENIQNKLEAEMKSPRPQASERADMKRMLGRMGKTINWETSAFTRWEREQYKMDLDAFNQSGQCESQWMFSSDKNYKLENNHGYFLSIVQEGSLRKFVATAPDKKFVARCNTKLHAMQACDDHRKKGLKIENP